MMVCHRLADEVDNTLEHWNTINRPLEKFLKIAAAFYFGNIILGGLYVVTAVDGVFLGWLSLIHLLVGACVFLTLATTYLLITLTKFEETNVPN